MFQQKEITVNVIWPDGNTTKVTVPELSQTKAILDLVYPPNSLLLYPFLLYNGRFLDLTLTVKSQGIENNDTLVIYEHSTTFNYPYNSPYFYQDPLEIEIARQQDLNNHKKLSALKRTDLSFANIDNAFKAQEIYQEILKEQNKQKENYEQYLESNNLTKKSSPTVLPDKASEISSAPLPLFFECQKVNEIDENENSETDSVSIDQENNNFYTNKQACHEWTW